MKTLLRIDSSARKQGSHSRALADYFQTLWLQANPGGQIVSRDLAETLVPHLSNSTIAAFTGVKDTNGSPPPETVTLSDALIAELEAADHVVVSSPLYNFNVPSTLKAWIDHVIPFGRTFGMNEYGYFGMLPGEIGLHYHGPRRQWSGCGRAGLSGAIPEVRVRLHGIRED